MKKMLIVSVFIVTVCIAFVVTFRNAQKNDSFFDANVEALVQSESGSGTDAYRFERESFRCTIHIGTNGKIILKSGTILKADANGYVSFDGGVACKLGGSYACRTIDCIDLYEVIFD